MDENKETIWDILKTCLEKLPGFFGDRKTEKIYLMAAPWLFLILYIICVWFGPKIELESILTDWGMELKSILPDWGMGLVGILSEGGKKLIGIFPEQILQLLNKIKTTLIMPILHFLVNYAVPWGVAELLKFVSEKLTKLSWIKNMIEKRGAYEKIQNHYYLKPQYVKIRNIFQKIPNILSILTTMVLAFVAVSVLSNAVIGEQHLLVLDYICVWCCLEKEYLSGNTYEETLLLTTEPKSLGSYPVRSLHNVVETLLKNCNVHESVWHYPVKYGVSYPDNSDSRQYRTLFDSLMKEENVLIEDIFYHDWSHAFILPLHAMLLKDRKAILFLGPSMDAEKIKDWMQEQLRHMLAGKNWWIVNIWEEPGLKCDVEIVPFEQILRFILCLPQNFNKVKGVFQVVLEPSKIIAEMQYYLEEYAAYIQEKEMLATYCFADRHMEGLLDYLSHTFRCHIENVETAVDKSEDVFVCDALSFDGAERSATRILDALVQSGARNIYYVSKYSVAVKDLFNDLKRSKLASDQEKYTEIQFYRGIWEIKKPRTPYIVVENEWNHYFDLYRYLSTRGTKFSTLFILDRNSCMQEFMIKAAKDELDNRGYIAPWFPIYQDTERNRLLTIIRYFAKTNFGVPVELKKIKEIFPEWYDLGAPEILKGLNEISKANYGKEIFSLSNGCFSILMSFLKENDRLWKEVLVVDEERMDRPLGSAFMCQLFQRWMPGQIIARSGCAYEVLDCRKINVGTVLVLRRSSQFWDRARLYFLEREIKITSLKRMGAVPVSSSVNVERLKVDVTVTTHGWYTRDDLGNNTFVRVCDIPERMYRAKNALRLSCEDVSAGTLNLQDLSGKFEEIFRSIFPYHYFYLYYEYTSRIYKKNRKSIEAVLILEDSEDDLGLLESIENRMDEILRLASEL